MDQRDAVIDLDGLTKRFEPATTVLDGLTLHIRSGSIYGFLGLNGAGKTTTIRIIAGLLRPEEGTVRLFGTPWDGTDRATKARMGFVLDEPFYFDWLSARQYIAWSGRMYGIPAPSAEQRAMELLAFFDLPADPGRQIRSFSTGMKKKVSLAAAIIHNPALLVLDEPFEGIDPVAARDIVDALAVMAGKGTTVLITSHILDTVEQVCSHLGIIHNGRMILECGMDEYNARAEDLLQHSATGSLRDLFVRLVGEHRRKPALSYV